VPARSGVTIRDVAALAGVSHQTVSRVINGNERVSPETRRKVEDAIARLDFRPNAIARFMASGRTHTLACISPNLTDYTFARIIEGAETEARQSGFFVISASAQDEAAFGTLLDELVASRRTEGLMVINPYVDQRFTLLPEKFPLVFLGARARDSRADAVHLDDLNAGCLATQHLLDLGHTRIALLAGPIEEDCVCDRLAGYQQALSDAGIQPQPDLISYGDWSASTGYDGVRRLLAEKIPFSAVFAQNDRIAVGAIRALREAGLSIPQDVSIIGFDDMPLSAYFDPALTTMRQDLFEIGRVAVCRLIERIHNPFQPVEQLSLSAELVVRSSTAAYQRKEVISKA
jgi:DNA-binding LacI/PurR family transcriptional regulator